MFEAHGSRTTIRAELEGSDRAAALGLHAVGYAPVTMLARKLIRAGVDAGQPLEVYRDGTLALRASSLATAARLTVTDDVRGVPRLAEYRPPLAGRHRRRAGESARAQR